jgi:uncharacterized protein (DUF1778 family)
MSDDTARSSSGTSTRQRRQQLVIRCTDDERAGIAAAAERAGMTVGAFMRHQALGTAGPRAARRPVIQKMELAQVLGLLGRVGGNVNQLARAFNTDGTTPAPAAWATVSADMHEMRDALMRALGQTP